MSTHIIHFDEKTWEAPEGEQYYQCREIPWWSTTGTTISRLTPYTEDSAYAHGYTEAESKYREIRDELEKEAYQRGYKDGYNKHDTERIRKRGYDKGLDDIGNALRLLLFQYSNHTLQAIFGYDTARAVVENFEGSEIVARIRCYEGGVKQDVETIRKEAYEKGYETAKHECEDCTKNVDLDAIRKEAYDKCMDEAEMLAYELYSPKIDEAYQKGLSDAWEAARKLQEIDINTIHEIFGWVAGKRDVFITYTASEVIEKIRQYEQEQEYDNSIRNAVMDFMSKTGYNADQIMEAAEALQKKKEEEENDLV